MFVPCFVCRPIISVFETNANLCFISSLSNFKYPNNVIIFCQNFNWQLNKYVDTVVLARPKGTSSNIQLIHLKCRTVALDAIQVN